MLLGRDLGKKILGKWLLEDPPNPENTVRETRAQVSAEAEQELNDRNDLIASGATPHLLSDVFPFEDEIFEDTTVHATPPSKHAESLPLPTLTDDISDLSLLIQQQQEDPSLKTIRELAKLVTRISMVF